MPPISIVSSTTSNLSFAGGEYVPEKFKFPANTVIPYYGNTPVVPDWERYTVADGKYLFNTLTQSQIGTALAGTNGSLSISGSATSAGVHSGTAFTQNLNGALGTGGSLGYLNGSADNHSHTYSGSVSGSATESILNRQKITFLRATRSVAKLPPNALVTKQTAPNSATAFTAAGSNYLVGAVNDQTFTAGVPFSGVGVASISSNGGHLHIGTSTAYKPYAVGAYLRNYNYQYGGAHGHTASISFSQSTISSKLINLWKMAVASSPQTDMIVMYVGTLGAIPAPWYVCDGNNGTVNLGSYVIGYSDGQWNVVTSANNIGYLTINTASVSHFHNSGYASTANVAGPSAQHNTLNWSHTHGTMVFGGTPFVPPRIGVAFIQYKGIIP